MDLIDEVVQEAKAAQDRFGPFTSSHEGYGVLVEEVAELLYAITSNGHDQVRLEAIQVAAVAFRIVEACDTDAEFQERSGF